MFGNNFCPIELNTDNELSSQAAQEKNLEKKAKLILSRALDKREYLMIIFLSFHQNHML